MSGRSNRDVEAISFYDQELDFFPECIELFFTNIRLIHFRRTKLKEIMAEDLKPFPILEVFVFDFNELETLDGDLFTHNPNIRYVDFSSNKLTNVGPKIFEPLKQLSSAFILENPCMDQSATNTAEVAIIARDLNFRCPPSVRMIQRIILKESNMQRLIDEQVAESISVEVSQLRWAGNKQWEEIMRLHERLSVVEKFLHPHMARSLTDVKETIEIE